MAAPYADPGAVKVYTVNGAASGSASSLPDWLTRKRLTNGKGKRARTEHIEGTINLIQHFEFPEASNRIRTTLDGHHAIATGTYKPQMRVYDLDQLALKFERHSEAENVDFVILSEDWTKTVHLQSDRSIELHTQSGFYYRTRIPRFGRALAYHAPSCDVLVGGSSSQIYRLNLDQGRFMNPLTLGGEGAGEVEGVNAIDINPAHQLFSFGIAGEGTVEFWDPRSRARVGVLRLPTSQLLPVGGDSETPAVTALSSRSDGLSLAVGTSTGHTLLYDIRSSAPYAIKDQGYGLPVENVSWIDGGHKMAGEGLVISADKKVLKIWDRNSPATNFTSVTPATDINHVHHVPGSGMIMLANEGIEMTTYYVPQLGPAPRWCSFLDNITEEMEEQTTRNVYEDFKFVERSELSTLGLDHLVGTPALKPYMHGYFLSLELYNTARLIANPYAYAEHRDKLVQEKMAKLAESRIRTRKEAGGAPKVNRALAERLKRNEEKAEKKKTGKGKEKENNEGKAVMDDPRFKEVFENPEYEIDETSREFALLNPSSFAHKGKKPKNDVDMLDDEGSDAGSGDMRSSASEEESDDDTDGSDDEQSQDRRAYTAYKASQTRAFQARQRPQQQHRQSDGRNRPRLVPTFSAQAGPSRTSDPDASFGQLRRAVSSRRPDPARTSTKSFASEARPTADGGMEMSFIPSPSSSKRDSDRKKPGKKVETFGAGLQKGVEPKDKDEGRGGRMHRRTGMRSGSGNAFRNLK